MLRDRPGLVLLGCLGGGFLGVCTYACILWNRSIRLQRERLYVETMVQLAGTAIEFRRRRGSTRDRTAPA